MLWPFLNTRNPPTWKITFALAVFSPDLRRVHIHSATGLVHYSTTIKLIPPSNVIKVLFQALESHSNAGSHYQTSVYYGAQSHVDRSESRLWLVRNRPTRLTQ